MATFKQIYSTRILAHSSLISPKDKIASGSSHVLQYSPRRSRGAELDWHQEAFQEDVEGKSFRKWSSQILFPRQATKKEVALRDFSQMQMSSSVDGLAFSSSASASPRYKIELSEKNFNACGTPTIRHPSDLFADLHLLDDVDSDTHARTGSVGFAQTSGNLSIPSMPAADIPSEKKLRINIENNYKKDQSDEDSDGKNSVERTLTKIHPLMDHNEDPQRSLMHLTPARTPPVASAKAANDEVVVTGKDDSKLMKQSSKLNENKREMFVGEGENKNVSTSSGGVGAEETDAQPRVIDHNALQKEIEQLKKKLNEKEQLLHSDDKATTETESLKLSSGEMQAKIDALQQELLKKERLSQSEQYHLSQKQNEIADLRSMLQIIHEDIVQKNEETANMAEEIDKLRCQVAALRHQQEDDLDLSNKENELHSLHRKVATQHDTTEASSFSYNDLQTLKKEIMETEGFWLPENEQNAFTKMDSARRMYLAAVLTAREKPGEESLALAAEFKMQLQLLLSQPEVSAPLDNTLASRDLILRMF